MGNRWKSKMEKTPCWNPLWTGGGASEKADNKKGGVVLHLLSPLVKVCPRARERLSF